MDIKEQYSKMFSNYPDIIDIEQMRGMLGGISRTLAYRLIFVAIKNTPIKLPVLITALYGLRRIETLGLKWDAIDFENKTIVIRHTISQTKVDGKLQIDLRHSCASLLLSNKVTMKDIQIWLVIIQQLIYTHMLM